MKVLFALGFGILLLGGCKDAQKTGEMPAAESPKLRELTVMEGYPEGFAGCSCTYSRNREEYRQQRFVCLETFGMVDSAKNFKMISLDGTPIRWYSGETPEGFTVEVLQDSEKQTDLEVREIEGRLVIRFSDGQEASTPVYGVCGC
ncbi:hypothetical protein [Robiginitalea marina]|uniref:Copper resistance protein NlpE n=1 Tax=Robiginitalea marina TaxID=2954105 RepID=A0ABT1B0X9_9FLAO|nr:hypothetical protein [Robiginitalea marina]MCO5725068.1 hypothetical protein [Robiginitalea marina]